MDGALALVLMGRSSAADESKGIETPTLHSFYSNPEVSDESFFILVFSTLVWQ